MPKLKITNAVLTEMMDRKVYWHEMVVPMYIRVHYDQKRYLCDCEDVSIVDINSYLKSKEMANIDRNRCLSSLELFPPFVILFCLYIAMSLFFYVMLK